MSERPLLIQAHWTDFQSCSQIINDSSVSLVHRAKDYFQRVILVCGDTPENQVIEQYALDVGVECFVGDLLDISFRFEQCMETLGLDQAARVLIYWFMVDFDFVFSCFDKIEEESTDIVILPRDFDIKFGSDVFSLVFLKKFRSVIGEMEGPLASEYRFRPWAFAESCPQRFRISTCKHVPVYGIKRFWEVRDIFNKYYPERFQSTGSSFSAYSMAASQLNSSVQRVADIACGWGHGTRLLAQRFPFVLGVDYSAEQISLNQKAFADVNNMQFLARDAMDETSLERSSVDAIVSIHTMEHLLDDKLFLVNCARWLSGKLVLEVPLLMTYPFKGIDMPLGEKHYREYKLQPLLDLCQTYFDIEQIYGVSRGFYVEPNLARNAVFLLLKVKK